MCISNPLVSPLGSMMGGGLKPKAILSPALAIAGAFGRKKKQPKPMSEGRAY